MSQSNLSVLTDPYVLQSRLNAVMPATDANFAHPDGYVSPIGCVYALNFEFQLTTSVISCEITAKTVMYG